MRSVIGILFCVVKQYVHIIVYLQVGVVEALEVSDKFCVFTVCVVATVGT